MNTADRIDALERHHLGLERRLQALEAHTVTKVDVTVRRIVQIVAEVFGQDAQMMLSPRRWKPLAMARQCAMALAAKHSARSLAEIGRRLDRDHTTVMHGVQAHEQRLRTDARYAALARRAEAIITTQTETRA